MHKFEARMTARVLKQDPNTSWVNCHLSFASYNIYYITPITRHCPANILPSTGHENKIAQQLRLPSHFSSFSIV